MQNKTGHDWQKSDLESVKTMLTKGYSRAKIATCLSEILGRTFTKGMISGVINRYDLYSFAPIVARPARINAPIRSKPSIPILGKTLMVKITKKKTTRVVAPVARRVEVHDYATCKWINGDPLDKTHSICGQPAEVNAQGIPKPYCPHHCSIAYVPNVRRVEVSEQNDPR